ncbi:unnamed protein product [Dicrocoelium dendriticum]|nr:unnamed protein product [Dicrocoelium dendriticum]
MENHLVGLLLMSFRFSAGLLHKEAVQLIKMYSSEVLLLVVQPASWAVYRTRDDPVAAAEAEAIVCTALSHSRNSPSSFFALTPAEEQLLSGDTTTMSVVHARRRQFLNMAGGGCQPYATVNQYDHVSG